MLKNILILGAILSGLAVSSPAQQNVRGAIGHKIFGQGSSAKGVPGQRSKRDDVRRQGRAQQGRGRSAPRARGQQYTRVSRSPGHARRRAPIVSTTCARSPRYRVQRVYVQGAIRRVYVPARFELRYDPFCGHHVRVCVRQAHYEEVRDPGHWEYRRVRVSGCDRRHHRHHTAIRHHTQVRHGI